MGLGDWFSSWTVPHSSRIGWFKNGSPQGEKIIMNGKVDLDFDGSSPIKVVLSPDKNNKSYAGTGVHNDENNDKSENIKLILEPLN